PGLLSTTTGCPRYLEALSAMPRNSRSAVTPAWNGTMRVTGFDGKASADSAPAGAREPTTAAAATAAESNSRTRIISFLPDHVLCCRHRSVPVPAGIVLLHGRNCRRRSIVDGTLCRRWRRRLQAAEGWAMGVCHAS